MRNLLASHRPSAHIARCRRESTSLMKLGVTLEARSEDRDFATSAVSFYHELTSETCRPAFTDIQAQPCEANESNIRHSSASDFEITRVTARPILTRKFGWGVGTPSTFIPSSKSRNTRHNFIDAKVSVVFCGILTSGAHLLENSGRCPRVALGMPTSEHWERFFIAGVPTSDSLALSNLLSIQRQIQIPYLDLIDVVVVLRIYRYIPC